MLQDNSFYAPPALSGAAFEDLLATFQSHVPQFRATPPSPRESFLWKSDTAIAPGLGVLRRTRYTADWTLAAETTDEYLNIVMPTAGYAEATIGTKAAVAPPLTALLMPAPLMHHFRLHCVDGEYASVTLLLDAGFVSKVLSALFEGAKLSKLDLAPLFDLSTGAGAPFHLLCQAIVSGMYGARLLERSPKAMPLLVEAMLRLIFENVPHRLSYRLNRGLLDATPRHVRKAIDFMHANMHQPLTMIDIAEASGVGVRSLQAGFQQFRDTTPVGYLRRIRLEAVHAELSSLENKLPVSEVALKWGFTQMGRFAKQYRATFGVYPSETASQARGRH